MCSVGPDGGSNATSVAVSNHEDEPDEDSSYLGPTQHGAQRNATRHELGGRWLTADYCMGDLLVFSMYTMHASTDNHTAQIRLSSDSRYQLASDPVDDRWIGDDPPLHGIRAHKAMIC